MTTRSQRWTAWMVAARAGDTSAFDRLVEEARPAIWRRAMGRLQDAALADDVASRTFINAWKAREGFDETKSNAGTWIYTIADRLTIDLLEQRAGRQGRVVTGFDSLASAGEEGEAPVRVEPEDDVELAPPEEAERPMIDELVRQAMAGLSASDQEILKLCYFERLSYEAIAGRLGIGMKAVGPRLTRARQRLLERLPPEALG